jgi:hypothetical protein
MIASGILADLRVLVKTGSKTIHVFVRRALRRRLYRMGNASVAMWTIVENIIVVSMELVSTL